MDRMAYLSLETYLEQLASDSPTPGGGAAAAVVAANGAALISMVASLTRDSQKADEAGKMAIELKGKCTDLVDADVAAFTEVMRAMKLPRQTDEEKAERTSILQRALTGAALPPLTTLKVCVEALKLAEQMVELGNRNVISDIGVAAELLGAAALASKFNVQINLKYLKDSDTKKTMASELEFLLSETTNMVPQIRKSVERLINPE